VAKQFALVQLLTASLLAAGTSLAAAALPLSLSALQGLEAQQAGIPSFDYALGLAALQAGQAELALAPLERVILTSPQVASAWLDLALAYAKLGQNTQALALLQEVQQRYAVPAETARRIEQLRQSLQQPVMIRWQRSLALVRGHSSNANQVSGERDLVLTPPGLPPSLVLLGDDQQPQADGFTRLRLNLAREKVGPAGSTGWRLLVTTQQYDHVRQASQDDLSLQWSHEAPVGKPWRMVKSVELRHVRQAQQPVLTLLRSNAGMQRPLAWQRAQLDCQLGAAVNLDGQQDSRPGFSNAVEASARSSLFCGRGRWLAGATLSLGRTQAMGPRPGGDQRQQEWQVPLRYRLNDQHSSELRFSQASYQDQSGYSPLISNNAPRQIRRKALSLQQVLTLPRWGRFSAQVERLTERSNISLFNNKAQTLSVGWEYDF